MKKKILILVSILVVFLAIPPFVNYWVSTPSSIGFIPIEKQEVWISFYASLIGSGITLLGVALTICYTDFTRKEDFRKHEHFLEFAKVIRQPGFTGGGYSSSLKSV